MTSLELSEIQSYLFKDYKEMGSSRYYLAQVKDSTAAKKFLAEIAESITLANATINETCLLLSNKTQRAKWIVGIFNSLPYTKTLLASTLVRNIHIRKLSLLIKFGFKTATCVNWF